MRPGILLLFAALNGAAQSAVTTVPLAYCPPLAFRDQRVVLGYKAIVRVQPGCQKSSYVRKINGRTGSVIGEPAVIKVGEVKNVWLFTHRLEYTTDRIHWQALRVQ